MARKTTPKPEAAAVGRSVFDGHLESICDKIEAGETMAAIAKSFKVHRSQLTRWMKVDPVREARMSTSRTLSADALAELAMENIQNAKGVEQSTKARDLAHHLRWLAKMRDPKRFGDKIEADLNHKGSVVMQITSVDAAL